jgi:hypothetical protein
MTTFGGSTIPPIFVNTFGGGVIEVISDNAIGGSTVAFAGNIFPINPNVERGHFRIGVNDDNGNNQIVFNQNWAGEPPIDPPDYVFNCVNQVGDPADFGNSAWLAAFDTGCNSLNNGARWVTAVGVARSVTLAFDIEYGNAPGANTCPRTSIFVTVSYVLQITWTG